MVQEGIIRVVSIRLGNHTMPMSADLFGYIPPEDSAPCEALCRRLQKEPDLILKWEIIADEAIAKGWTFLDPDWLLAEYKKRHGKSCTRVIRTGIMRVLLAKRPDIRRLYKPKGSKHFDRRPRA